MGDTKNTFDAIVIGTGMSGGWAAKEFCEKGLKTLVLERGRDVEHLKIIPLPICYPGNLSIVDRYHMQFRRQIQSLARCYAFSEDAMHFFVKDTEHPYVQEKPFDWIRGYQVGGKSLCGQDKHNAGATLILKARHVMVLQLTGPSGIKTLHHGIVM